LDENNVAGFCDYVRIASEVGADLNQPYGKESGFKTILHLALEEEDGEPYVRELLKVILHCLYSMNFSYYISHFPYLQHGAKADL
jgi:hypothetical protein